MAEPAFDPDAYLAKQDFDPDAYLAKDTRKGSAGQAALESFGNAATLGYLPQLQAGLAKLMPDPNAKLDAELKAKGFSVKGAAEPTYVENRDANIARQEQLKQDFPLASGAGTVAGIGGSALLASAAAPVKAAATVGARIIQGAKGGAAIGALANPGDTEGVVDPLQAGGRAKNAAAGGVLGAATAGAIEAFGPIAKKAGEWLENKAAKKATRALGRQTTNKMAEMAKTGEDVALGKTLLEGKAIPILGTPGRIAKRVDALKEKTWSGVEALLNKGGDDAVVDGAEAGMRILNSEHLALLREAGETQAVKALEDAAEQLAGMGKVSLQRAQRIKRTIDSQLNYNKAIPDMTGGQAARFSKRTALRDQMDETVSGLGAGKGDLKTAFKKHGSLEGASEILEKEIGRQQNNRAMSLTDTIMAGAGIASGAGPAESVARGALLGAVNKAGRSVGNAVQARGYNLASKLFTPGPALAAFAQKNPVLFQTIVNRLNQSPKNEKKGEGSEFDPKVLTLLLENPALIDSVADSKMREALHKRQKRAPAKKR